MRTLTYGLKVPETDDTGTEVFPALEENLEQLDEHAHDGVDSPVLEAPSVSIPSGSWGSDLGGGQYRQSVALPAGYDFDTVGVEIRTTAGIKVFAEVEKINDTSFYVYTNDNSQALLAVILT